jgi:uncharacterized protein (TIGR02246 family)
MTGRSVMLPFKHPRYRRLSVHYRYELRPVRYDKPSCPCMHQSVSPALLRSDQNRMTMRIAVRRLYLAFTYFFLVVPLAVLAIGRSSPLLVHQQTRIMTEQQVRDAFDTWTAAWNRGDADGYLAAYSDTARYVSGSQILLGKTNISRHFHLQQKDTSTSSVTAKLSLKALEVELLGAEDALAFGQFQLLNKKEEERVITSGVFTVHLRRIDGAWKIQFDHSSS